jgi:hypothetical protein
VRITPGPLQQPRIPIWFGTAGTGGTPISRAARHAGMFPLGNDPDGVKRIWDSVAEITR